MQGIQKTVFFSQTHKRNTKWVKIIVLLATMTRCASYPIVYKKINLVGDFRELLQKLDAFCFNYQHVDWPSVYFFSSTKSLAKLSRVENSLIMCRGQFISTTKTEKSTKRLASRRETLEEKYNKVPCAPFKKLYRCKQVDQSLQTDLNNLKRLIST